MLADILIDPERGIDHANQSCYGCSGFLVDGEVFWMNTTARGIELYRWGGHSVRQNCDLLPWPTVARFARALPARLVANLQACRQELTRSTLSHPTFPATASDDERELWDREEYRPWLARRKAIQARLEAALDAALASEDAQPALFDFDTARHCVPTIHRPRLTSRKATQAGQERLL
jgi:hypothetical protein